jgi:hypothetical protein
MDDIAKLTRRLEKLEAQSRRLKITLALTLLAASALLLMGQATPRRIAIPEGRQTVNSGDGPIEAKIRTQAIELDDARGEERASLVTDATGSVFFVLFDANGKARADLHVGAEGPSLNFYDPNSRNRFIAGSTSMVGSHVASVTGVVEKSPPSSIVMFDKDGKLIWRTP